MGDGRGPAHRSPAPAALLSAKALRAWLRAARGAGMHRYRSTTLHYREPARGADYYLTSLTIVMHREDLRDLLRQYSSTRPDYMFPMVRDGSVELFKHVMNMITSHPSALESPSRDSAL